METIIAVCGDVCSECPRYIATKSKQIDELEKVATLWHKLGFRDHVVSMEEIKCAGCKKKPACGYGLTSCEHLNGIENCGECEFFPCSNLESVFMKSDKGDEICRLRCSTEEYGILKKAFFSKNEILTDIHLEKFK